MKKPMNESATTMTPLRLGEMRLKNCYTNREGEEVGVHIVTRDRHEHERDFPIVGTVDVWRELMAHLTKVVGQAAREVAPLESEVAREREENERLKNKLADATSLIIRLRASSEQGYDAGLEDAAAKMEAIAAQRGQLPEISYEYRHGARQIRALRTPAQEKADGAGAASEGAR